MQQKNHPTLREGSYLCLRLLPRLVLLWVKRSEPEPWADAGQVDRTYSYLFHYQKTTDVIKNKTQTGYIWVSKTSTCKLGNASFMTDCLELNTCPPAQPCNAGHNQDPPYFSSLQRMSDTGQYSGQKGNCKSGIWYTFAYLLEIWPTIYRTWTYTAK